LIKTDKLNLGLKKELKNGMKQRLVGLPDSSLRWIFSAEKGEALTLLIENFQ
jgi:hypothetical protein